MTWEPGLRFAWGSALALCPEPLLRLVGVNGADRRTVVVARVLGGRHLIQGVAECWFGDPARRAGVAIDSLHAMSMVALGLADSGRRRATFVDALAAGTFAMGTARVVARRRL